MRYPKLRELKEAIKSLFSRPYTSKFPYKPSIPYPRFRGKPEFDEHECVGCGACAQVCPPGTIDVEDDVKAMVRRITLRLESCIFCGQCQANCITEKGVQYTNEYDLATFDRSDATVGIEKELLLCEHCGDVVGTKDHLRFLAKRLGPLAYGNPLLILTAQQELKIAEPIPTEKIKPPLRRPALFRILCPKCRREVMLVDEWGK